jgi:predicted nucleotidyltransferase
VAKSRKKSRRTKAQRNAPAAVIGLSGALQAVSGWLSEAEVDFAVVGGVAASLHGRPRVTKDVDVVAIAENDRWPELVKKAEDWGLRPRIDDALEFARTTRVLLLMHEPTRIEVDLSFGMLPFENELVRRAEIRKVNRIRFPLASAEDIIVMKALALRPRDVADIESIVELSQELDLDRVRSTVAQLSEALESDDHLSRLDEILRRARP